VTAFFDPYWIAGVLVIIAGVIAFFGLIHVLEYVFERMEIRRLVKKGRCIDWKQATERCQSKEGFLVIERRRMPRKVWFVPGSDIQLISPVQSIKVESGFIVVDPPPLDDRLVNSAEFSQRILEINFGGVMYLA
jgi:hypothetical protein